MLESIIIVKTNTNGVGWTSVEVVVPSLGKLKVQQIPPAELLQPLLDWAMKQARSNVKAASDALEAQQAAEGAEVSKDQV